MASSAFRRWLPQCHAFFSVSLLLAVPVGAQTLFTDVTEQVGLDAFLGIEARNVVFVDYDNDGFQDVFITESEPSPRRIGLFHNTGDGRLEDQTFRVPADLHLEKGRAGSIFGDYDNDGDDDLFLPVFPHNVLLRNDRGLFVEVDPGSALTDSIQTDGALWLDYDRDGYLDLYVSSIVWRTISGQPDAPRPNRLLRNQGDGTFADQTVAAGLDILFHPEWGGYDGAMAAGDFNDDGWPDLYIGVYEYPNRLFLNDGQGGFQDVTRGDIADEGQAFSIAVGDIDNDGDLDIFQAAGGEAVDFRSLLLLNLGDGEFLDITEAAGLGVELFGLNTGGTTFADVDNDGDLDLFAGRIEKESGLEYLLLLNDGTGMFVDQTAASGIEDVGSYVAVGDYDEDGFVDLLFASFTRQVTTLYRNNGNGNHWLRVELVGIESNRNGIGTRLLATSGDLTQMREILGGVGRQEDERIAHFGLGSRTQVDRLEIRWPSGQVDVLTDIPADQKIRVIEGRERYHPTIPTDWTAPPPDSLVAGSSFSGVLAVRPALFEPGAEVTAVVADLSEMGGPSSLPLQPNGDGTWRADIALAVPEIHGYNIVTVMIDQSTSLGDYWTQLSRTLQVLPAEDHVVFSDELEGRWQLGPAQDDAMPKLGFISERDGTPEPGITGRYATPDLELIDADGKNRMRLTHTAGIVSWKPDRNGNWQHNWDWSPDGTRIVFATDWDGPLAIYVMNVDGSGLRQLTYPQDDQFDMQPAWSPDGTKIIFTSGRQVDFTSIYVVDADGGTPLKLTDSPAADANAVWSPDGTRIAFASTRDSEGEVVNEEIYVMNADGSDPVRLTDNPNIDNNPAWSPDGTKIAFLSMPFPEGAPRFRLAEIYVMDADGGNPVNISNNETIDWNPVWSPDGTRIAFISTFSWDITVVNADGSNPVQLTSEGGNYLPLWLPAAASSPAQVLNAASPSTQYQGKKARQLQAEKIWMTSYESDLPRDPTGYRGVGFSFHPGDAELSEGGWLKIRINDKQIDLLDRLDVTRREWQEVEIPVAEFAQEGPVARIEFSGTLKGTFYLADIRLVTSAGDRPVTAVTEEQTGLPGRFSLAQNYPNPFNSATVIRFALPTSEETELAIFNLAGQQVATLVEGAREAGTYTVNWDGRDDDGRELASGVYLYRLQTGDGHQVETRKLLLLR